MIKAGLQIPNYTYPDVAAEELFERVADIAGTAERSGFDTVMVMDHFFQLPLLGPPEHEMFEAYTLLAALAARTSTARLGTFVTGVTYRNPALLAKQVTALDVISKGRAFLGIGAAWFDVEHDALGFDFPPVRERFERLEEALHICRAMFRGERPTFEGRHYRVKDAINSPAPIQPGGPPIMIGGQGERRTLRLMAEHAEMANIIAGRDELPRKLDVLSGHCADVGRDPASINKTCLLSLFHAPTMEAAVAKVDTLLATRGVPRWSDLDETTRGMFGARFLVGDRDAIGEQVRSLLDLGLDGVIVNMPEDGHDIDAVAAGGAALAAAVG
jgi:F420-dependent oxidoreductase-like protein